MPLLRKDAEQKRLQKNAAQRNYRAQLREHKAAGEQKSKAQSTGEERKALPTTNLPISEAKRLRKNAMARERYAERREEKVAGQQKCKHVSAARKRTALATIKPVPEAKRLKKNAMARKRYAELPTEEKEAILKRQRQSYAARQHNARTGPPKQSTLKATSLEKGKTQTSLYSSYEIGTSSSHHFETVQLTKGHQLPPTDFYIPTKKHIILLATSKVNYLATEATKTPAKHGENGDNNAIDEIQQYQSARWVSGAEAVWRIFRFVMNEMHPAVQSLHLHLPVLNHRRDGLERT